MGPIDKYRIYSKIYNIFNIFDRPIPMENDILLYDNSYEHGISTGYDQEHSRSE